MRQSFLRMVGESHLSPLQWDVAALPLSVGGLALPEMEREAALARAAVLMTLPRSPCQPGPAGVDYVGHWRIDRCPATPTSPLRLTLVTLPRRLMEGTPRLVLNLLVHHVSDNFAERSSRVLPVHPQLWPFQSSSQLLCQSATHPWSCLECMAAGRKPHSSESLYASILKRRLGLAVHERGACPA